MSLPIDLLSNSSTKSNDLSSTTQYDPPSFINPKTKFNDVDSNKGSMTNTAHPFFYIIFGGAIFIVITVVITIFGYKYLKRKYDKFMYRRRVLRKRNSKRLNSNINTSDHQTNSRKIFKSNEFDDDDEDIEQMEYNHMSSSQDNINFDNRQQNTRYNKGLII